MTLTGNFHLHAHTISLFVNSLGTFLSNLTPQYGTNQIGVDKRWGIVLSIPSRRGSKWGIVLLLCELRRQKSIERWLSRDNQFMKNDILMEYCLNRIWEYGRHD